MSEITKQSEYQFIEWSEDIRADQYDVVQVAHVLRNLAVTRGNLLGLDVGGGIGRYAQLLCEQVPDCRITVLDRSALAVDGFVNDKRVQLQAGDFFRFEGEQRYDFIILKTVLHHFITDNETSTTDLQKQALKKAHELLKPGGIVLIEENFYQGILGDDLPGKLIFAITRQKSIERITRRLGANTAGEGVRFRSLKSWIALLQIQGFTLHSLARSPTWGRQWPWWQKIPLLSSGRFQGVLEARHAVFSQGQRQLSDFEAVGNRVMPSPLRSALAGAASAFSKAWNSCSVRLRFALAIVAVSGPALTSWALSES